MVKQGEIVYVQDIDGNIYEAEVLDVDEKHASIRVGYDMDTLFKEIWVSFGHVTRVRRLVSANAALIY